MPPCICLTLTVCFVAHIPNAYSQTPSGGFSSDALQQQRQQDRERQLRQQLETAPDVRLVPPSNAPEAVPADERPCFPIRAIELNGAHAREFAFVLQQDAPPGGHAQNQCLGARGISALMRRMQNAIIERGYVTTRIVAPEQDLTKGTLQLTLIPGRIRAIRFVDPVPERATWRTALPAREGDLLNLRDIEQALENYKRVPSVEADIQIVPAQGAGAGPGDSDLEIRWSQDKPFRLTLTADDSGTRATGRYIGTATVSADNLFTLQDLMYLTVNHNLGGGTGGARGTRGHTFHYSLPFGYWQLGFTASRNTYHQTVAGATQNYIYSGESENSEIKLSRNIWRDAVRKTTLWWRGWLRTSSNYIDDTEIEVQRRRMAGFDIGLGHRQANGSALLEGSLTWREGTAAMNSTPAPEETFGEGTSQPRILLADLNCNAPFSLAALDWRYTLNVRAQWSRTPLVPLDRFAIGGRYTVRGFDGESVLSAERGWLARNDLGVMLGASNQQLYAGIDYGRVGGPSSVGLLGKQLAGAVFGLRGGQKNFSYDVFTGWPLYKPSGFSTAPWMLGFNASFQY